MRPSLFLVAIGAFFSRGATPALAAQPSFNASGPEAALFGADQDYPVGDRDTWGTPAFAVGSYSHFDRIFPTHLVARAAAPSSWRRSPQEPAIHYLFHGRTGTIDTYLAHFPVMGFLLLRDDTILVERYQYGRRDSDRFTSNSMAKSVMALLVGVAIAEGKIRSVEDRAARYIPRLQGSLYGEASLRTLLQMSSGINFDYPTTAGLPSADSRNLLQGEFKPNSDLAAQLAGYDRRVAPPGEKFHYSGGDSLTVGIALRRAVGVSLAEYLSAKIWQPIGAEADASWVVDTSGQEYTFYGFNAALRDYGRLGRLMAHDGAWGGRQILPRQWMIDATANQSADRQVMPGAATPYYGYGYQIWILPGARRMFVLRGTDSQYVFVDPRSKLVLVQTAVRSEAPNAENGRSETLALWLALVKQLGDGAI
jgi:CubicO group peptidase (beta-lactamase class C family)